MTGPYREAPPAPTRVEVVDRPWWPVRLWRRWWFRRCWRGAHHPELTMEGFTVSLLCPRCGATRPLKCYGPCAFQAVGEWSS